MLFQITTILVIESVNLWLLTQQSGILDTIKDYLALGCIAQFDDYFVETYKNSFLNPYSELSIPIEHFVKDKIVIKKDEWKDFKISGKESVIHSRFEEIKS
jgi:hypothetical protein